MVFMPYLLTLHISLPSWAAFKWLFWNLCGLAPLLRPCLFFTLAPKTNSAGFVRQDLPFMKLGRSVFISSYFSRCWVISSLLTWLKTSLWFKLHCRAGARISASGNKCTCILHALVPADNLLPIFLGFFLSLVVDAQIYLRPISFSSYLQGGNPNLLLGTLSFLLFYEVAQVPRHPPHAALFLPQQHHLASEFANDLICSLLCFCRALCFCACSCISGPLRVS